MRILFLHQIWKFPPSGFGPERWASRSFGYAPHVSTILNSCVSGVIAKFILTGNSGIADKSILKNAPDWFKTIPVEKGILYAIGTAKSRRLNLASDKAVTKAQISLAEQVKLKTESAGGADTEDVTESDLDIVLKKSLIKNQTQIKEGKLWRVYVLLEMELE